VRRLIYIHGAGASPGDPPWPAVSASLGDGWTVTAPDLGEPDAKRWIDGIDAALEGAPEDAVLFAHSLGVSVLIQAIALRRPGLRAAGLVGLAGPFWGGQDWDVSEYVLPEGFPDALSGIDRIVLFHSRDDEEVSFEHLDMWARRLPRAELHALDGVDHVASRGDISSLITVLRSL